ncbi:unnamed protein product [Schistosoma curassoni]|uniref:Ion transport domain-containing protein n=1 Tax=Schistosoma curassoni TaxID=6186 RepID=A0A183JG11_9TREM|nr:unnamed protein product [Schistosoma curassoni]
MTVNIIDNFIIVFFFRRCSCIYLLCFLCTTKLSSETSTNCFTLRILIFIIFIYFVILFLINFIVGIQTIFH